MKCSAAAAGALVLAIQGVLAGCATQSAPDAHGKWRAVNRYPEVADEIPLYPAYVYYASPMDGTLKTLLTRWAQDAKLTLAYHIASDYSLYAPVAQVRTLNLQEALTQLTSLYADKGIELTLVQNQIIVQRTRTAAAAESAGTASADTTDEQRSSF